MNHTQNLSAGIGIDQIVIVGCGTVGIALTAAFLTRGFQVLGIDSDPERLAALSRGAAGEEIALTDALQKAIVEGRVEFGQTLHSSSGRRAYVIAVPTPVDAASAPVTSNVDEAFAAIADSARASELVVVRSTVPIGTTRRLGASAPGLRVASCPDRCAGGASLAEQFSVPHIIGGLDPFAAALASALFSRLGEVVTLGSPEAAEAAKLFCNVQRDTLFAIANQFALIAESLGLDFDEIRTAAGHAYPRFLATRARPVGGPCLPKDVHILAAIPGGRALAGLSLAGRELNHSLLDLIMENILAHLSRMESKGPATVAILGLGFKAGTTDRRGSFGLALGERLQSRRPDILIRTFEPADVDDYRSSVRSTVAGTAVAVLANDHPAFAAVPLTALADELKAGGMIYDLCGTTGPAPLRLPRGVVVRVFGRGSHGLT